MLSHVFFYSCKWWRWQANASHNHPFYKRLSFTLSMSYLDFILNEKRKQTNITKSNRLNNCLWVEQFTLEWKVGATIRVSQFFHYLQQSTTDLLFRGQSWQNVDHGFHDGVPRTPLVAFPLQSRALYDFLWTAWNGRHF